MQLKSLFAAIAFSIVSAFCANRIQPTLLPATSKVALHWSGMIVEFQIYQSLPKKKTTVIAVAEANFSSWKAAEKSYVCWDKCPLNNCIFFFFAHQWKTVRFGDAEMQISVAGCSWGVCFAAIAFSIVPAFCANGIQLTLLSATSKVALHWPGMIVEFRIYQSLPKKKTTVIAVAEANFS